jgi:toxin ParE1/3/4
MSETMGSVNDRAIRDLDSICDLIAINNPDAASNLFDDIRKQCVRIARFPFSGKKYDEIHPNLRGFIVANYIIFYAVDGENILIIRVINGYRDLVDAFDSD